MATSFLNSSTRRGALDTPTTPITETTVLFEKRVRTVPPVPCLGLTSVSVGWAYGRERIETHR